MGNSSSRITAQDQAILDLKLQRDKLHQYQRRITHLTSLETSIAKQLLAKGDKPRALLALRRKKYQESLLAKTDAQLEQLEKLTSSVEFALIQKDVLYGLQQGTKVLQAIHAEMGGIEKVERLMGETAEEIAFQNEVSEIIAGRISVQDEEDVEDELAALEAEVAKKDEAGVERLPSVPDTQLPERRVGENTKEQPAAERRTAMLA
ncbi:Vacuolar protein sorting-associated protein 20 [Collariella sp. IMI 366227]|nr:Vacuolar protein sorting-associated protein 20 [Collariella sp. IMI 366227]